MKTVLLHGLGQTAKDWEEVTTHMFSYVDCPEIFSSENNDSTYAGVFFRLQQKYSNTAEPLCICGLSLGALLALDFAIRNEDKVTSLVLIAAQYKAPKLLLDVQNLIFQCMPSKMFDAAGISKKNMIALTRSMRSLDFSSQLNRITCPVTIVCGEKDRANLKASKKLKALLPQASLYIIPGAGHEVNKAAPQALANILNRQGTAVIQAIYEKDSMQRT